MAADYKAKMAGESAPANATDAEIDQKIAADTAEKNRQMAEEQAAESDIDKKNGCLY